MKFDNMYKLVAEDYGNDNPEETEEFEELESNLEDESEEDVTDEIVDRGIDMDEGFREKPQTPEEQIDYLVRVLPLVSPANRDKSEDELLQMANDLIKDDLFDTIYDAHEELMGEPVPEEDVPEDIGTDKPIRGPMGDEPDVPGLTEYEKEQRAMDRFREEEEGLAPKD